MAGRKMPSIATLDPELAKGATYPIYSAWEIGFFRSGHGASTFGKQKFGKSEGMRGNAQ
jgi:hypothetical protein